jgi:hypothetical protein
MIELLNRLIEKHGSRLEVVSVTSNCLELKLHNFGSYRFLFSHFPGDRVTGYQLVDGDWRRTENSRWLLAIAQGKSRDAEGRVG